MKRLRLTPYRLLPLRDATGFDHLLGAVICFVAVGLIGTFMLVASHAYTVHWKGVLEEGSAGSGYCLTTSGSANGSKIVLGACSKTSSNTQNWSLNYIKQASVLGSTNVEEFTLQSQDGKTECLNDPYGSKTSGTQLQVYTCHSNDKNNLWVWGGQIKSQGLNYHQLINVATVNGSSASCIDNASSTLAAGSKVELTACKTSSQTNQTWFEQSTPSTSGSGSVSTCTNPSWNSSDAEGTDQIGSGDLWWVNNDAWSGSHGPQTLYVCSQSSWYAVSNQTNNGGQVETYPDTEYDIAGRGNATQTIAQLKSITSTFSEAYPSAGTWDGGYDLWTDDWTNETMIWNQWAGAQDYWPTQAKTAVTLDGVPYHFLANGSELMFFRDTQVSSGSVDILAAFQWEVAHGYAKSTDIPTQLEYGVEICATNGNETFPMTGVSFTVN